MIAEGVVAEGASAVEAPAEVAESFELQPSAGPLDNTAPWPVVTEPVVAAAAELTAANEPVASRELVPADAPASEDDTAVLAAPEIEVEEAAQPAAPEEPARPAVVWSSSAVNSGSSLFRSDRDE